MQEKDQRRETIHGRGMTERNAPGDVSTHTGGSSGGGGASGDEARYFAEGAECNVYRLYPRAGGDFEVVKTNGWRKGGPGSWRRNWNWNMPLASTPGP